ncbi:Uma2 family endonuclease [Herpetosiphon llansteffanensis]|uniref:Uma2 family endonuclease n=1 Tax=Herpetosiphon llansteffanensis TaxID=2094568 RepID=UPI000D7C1F25|nr:Uma2 family endonuclease [Herpetosiphon llansteffanensis]
MTTQTLIDLQSFLQADFSHAELVHGVVQPVSPVQLQHSLVVTKLLVRLSLWNQSQQQPGLVGTELGFVLGPNTLRAADVFFINADQLGLQQRSDGYWQGAPTVAVEVISPNERAIDVEEKINDYLAANVQLMWIIYPRLGSVHQIEANQQRLVLGSNDCLEHVRLLPQFIVPIRELLS